MYRKEIMALLSIKGLGTQTLHKLLEAFGSIERLVDIVEQNRLSEETGLKRLKDASQAYHQFDYETYKKSLEREGVQTISFCEKDYPVALKNIQHFPLLLHYKGDISELNELPMGVAVVGSRKISAYGRRVAFDLGRFLGRCALPVVSGLAYGVDHEVHQGVVKSDGFPVAVVANGLETIYPSSHQLLAKTIVDSGILLTEEFLYSRVAPFKFPIRNRLISGLSRVIVVVEAELKSGSLITAEHALEQGKTVYAVPGSIYSSTSKGTNKLIADGAIPLTDFEQVFDEYNEILTECNTYKEETELDERSKKIIKQLKEADGLSVEALSVMLGLPVIDLMVSMMTLEINGHIRCLNGNKYTIL